MSGDILNPSPTIREIALAIQAQLQTYAIPRGGKVKIVANQRHLWEEIYVVDESPRIFIWCSGEIARGEYAGGDRTNLHRVDRQWKIVIMRGHGFKNLIAESNPKNGFEDFYDSMETIRDGIRVMSNISEEFPVNYKTLMPLPSVGQTQNANVFMDCMMLEFDTASDIPRILDGVTG